MKKFMKIYWPFTINEVKREFAYKGKFYLYVIGSLFTALISYYLWKAIYSNSTSEVLGGFSQSEIIGYVFISFITSQIVSISISGEIAENVFDGSIAMNLIKPMDYRLRLIAKAAGTMLYRFVMPSFFVWCGFEIYKVCVLKAGVTSLINIILFILSCLNSFFIYVLFDVCFGLLVFYTGYFFGLKIVEEAVFTLLSGKLIPLTFFPKAIENILNFLPFSSMNYTPVMIYLGKLSSQEVMIALLKQLFWVIFFYVLGSVIWKKLSERLVVLGG